MKCISLKEVSVKRAGRTLLDNINLEINANELSVIFGPNGAGKTTLLRVICGLLAPSCGSVTIAGKPPREGGARLLGYVPQGAAAERSFPISAIEAVLTGRYARIGVIRRPNSADHAAARDALAQVGCTALADRNIGALSGGERQRIFLARALAAEPLALLLDEPLSGVDEGVREGMHELLLRLRQRCAVVLVTHDLSVVARGVDQVVCLNRSLVSHGRPEEALTPEALKCMYGEKVSLFTHCHTPHFHVAGHSHD